MGRLVEGDADRLSRRRRAAPRPRAAPGPRSSVQPRVCSVVPHLPDRRLCTGGYPKDGRFRHRHGRRPRPLDRDSGAQRAAGSEGPSGRDRGGDAPARRRVGGDRRRRRLDRRHHRSDRGTGAGSEPDPRESASGAGSASPPPSPPGFDHARGATIVTIDGDGQDDPADIPTLLEALGDGADLVSGWKRDRRDPTHPQNRLPALQLGDRALHRRRHARHEQRLQGLPRGVRSLARGLRGDAPVPAGAGRPAGLASDRGAGQPPGAQLRQLPVRHRALPARRPRPPDRDLHRPLREPAPAPLRRHRAGDDRGRDGARHLPRDPEADRRDAGRAAASLPRDGPDRGRSPAADIRPGRADARPDQARAAAVAVRPRRGSSGLSASRSRLGTGTGPALGDRPWE